MALLGACKAGKAPGPDEVVVARVGDSVITAKELDERLRVQSRLGGAKASPSEQRKRVLDELIEYRALVETARRRGLDRSPSVVRVMEQQMVAELQRQIDGDVAPAQISDADIEKYYREHHGDFNRPTEVRISQIVVRDEARARRVLALAQAAPRGDDKIFRELVLKYSEDSTAKDGGDDLGFVSAETRDRPRAIAEAALALQEVGDVAGPIRSDSGFHVIKATQRRVGFARPLAEVKEQIRYRLLGEARARRTREFVTEARKRLGVTTAE